MSLTSTFVETAQPLEGPWSEVEHLIQRLTYLTRQQRMDRERYYAKRIRSVVKGVEKFGISLDKVGPGIFYLNRETLGEYTDPVEAEGMLRLVIGVVRDNIVRSYE